MQYRREIDGLRAVAIVPVVLFHAGVGLFPGGYVGVDVFFVISGYLITSIILAEMKTESFSVLGFYERRVRRLLPALFLVLGVSTLLALVWLLPSDLAHFFRSVTYASVFASNYRFYRVSDYFAPEADLQPLVHTWSLAIEEQYYLVFPLVLMLLRRLPLSTLPVAILAVGIISFALCQRALGSDPSAAFFLTPYRVWELMLGSLIAVLLVMGTVEVRGSETAAAIGLALIIASALMMTDNTPFPGVYALLPTTGAALVILFGTSDTVAGRLLGSRLFVGIGLVSYSAYLWHQPVFAFAKLRFGDLLSPWILALLAVFTFLLAWATWFLVEQPFRKARSVSRFRVFSVAIGATLAFFVAGHAGELVDRFQLRGDQFARIEHLFRGNDGLDRSCRDEGWTSSRCRTSETPEILVWGDSYAMHLVQAINETDGARGIVQATKGACPPVLGLAPRPAKRSATWSLACMRHNDSVLQLIAETPSIRYVALSSFFTTLASPESPVLLANGSTAVAAASAFDAFVATLDALKSRGLSPVVFAPPPQNGRNHGRCRAIAMLFGGDGACAFSLAEAEDHQRHERAFLRQVEARGHRVVWFDSVICPKGVCAAAREGVAIYRDVGHFTVEGSAWLGRQLQISAAIRGPSL